MARLWTDGFEVGDFAGYTLYDQAKITNVTTQAFGGTRSIRLTDTSTQQRCGMVRSVGLADEIWVRLAIRPTTQSGSFVTAPNFLQILNVDGLPVLQFGRVWSSGNIQVRAGNWSDEIALPGRSVATGTANLELDEWVVVEIYAKIGEAGTVQIRLDGSKDLDVDFTGDTRTPNSDAQECHSVVLGFTGGYEVDSQAMPGWYDDLAIDDEQWCGPGKVVYLPPIGDGIPQNFAKSDELLDYFEHINEVPTDGDTTYLLSEAAADEARFTLGGLPEEYEGSVVRRAWVEGRIRKTSSSLEATVKLGVDSDGTDALSDDLSIPVEYENERVLGNELIADPATAVAWGWNAFDTVELILQTTEPEE